MASDVAHPLRDRAAIAGVGWTPYTKDSGVSTLTLALRAVNARSEFRMGGTGRAAPDTVEFQYQAPYGFMTPPQQFAMAARAYMHEHRVTAEDLGRVAITQRTHALDNERAMMRAPLTMEEYLGSRWIVEPLRLFDCCLETDAAVALVVTSAERARDLRHVPALISGAAFGSGHTLYSNGRGDLTTTAATDMAPRLFAMAG